MALVTMLIGVKVVNKSGRFDIMTELYIMCNKNSPLHDLKNDTKQAFARIESGEDITLIKDDKDVGISKEYKDDSKSLENV